MSTALTDATVTSTPAHKRVKLSPLKQALFDIVLGAQRNGAPNMSLLEIRDAYERLYSKRIDEGNISGRVSELIGAGYLARLDERRPCSRSRIQIRPVIVPAHQAGLFR
ncbi:MAG: hypothetical protein ACRECD_01225 [Burkholderiaceae bacterium]